MFGRLGDSFTGLLAVSHFGIEVTWFLALVIAALWTCYCILRTFSDLGFVFLVISHLSFCLQLCWTEDASLTRNRFPNKAICDQIRLCHPRGVVILKWSGSGNGFHINAVTSCRTASIGSHLVIQGAVQHSQ